MNTWSVPRRPADESALDHTNTGRPSAGDEENISFEARILDLSAGVPACGTFHRQIYRGNPDAPYSRFRPGHQHLRHHLPAFLSAAGHFLRVPRHLHEPV